MHPSALSAAYHRRARSTPTWAEVSAGVGHRRFRGGNFVNVPAGADLASDRAGKTQTCDCGSSTSRNPSPSRTLKPRSVLDKDERGSGALHGPDGAFRVQHHDHLLSFRLPGAGGCDTGPFRTAPALLAPTLDIPHVYRYMSHHRVVLHRHPDPRQLKEREPALDGEVIRWARDCGHLAAPRTGLGAELTSSKAWGAFG